MAEYLASWLETIRPTVDPSTWKRHREYVDFHIVPKLGRIRVRDLTRRQCSNSMRIA